VYECSDYRDLHACIAVDKGDGLFRVSYGSQRVEKKFDHGRRVFSTAEAHEPWNLGTIVLLGDGINRESL